MRRHVEKFTFIMKIGGGGSNEVALCCIVSKHDLLNSVILI